ncbi:MAG: acyl-CoA dehydrogenase family protein [Acidimicrobiales bacterium]
MDFDLSDDQEALRDAARSLLDDHCSTSAVRRMLDIDGYDEDLWSRMVDQGWLGVAAATNRGGLGLGTVEAAVLLEQSGAHLAPVPFLQQLLALSVLDDTVWADDLLSGERIATVARRPVRLDDDGTVSGRPEPVIFGALADVLVVPTEDALVAVDLTAVERSAEPAMDGTRQLAWVELAQTPATIVGDGEAAAAFLARGAVYHAAEMLGGADALLALTVAYANEREQFGRPIGSFQAVKHRCADMLVDVEGMRSAVYHAAWAIGADDDEASLAAATAKCWCSDAGLRVAESSLQVHGGIGFTWEADVHLYLKRAQLDQISFGDASHHRQTLGAMVRERLSAGQSIIS